MFFAQLLFGYSYFKLNYFNRQMIFELQLHLHPGNLGG